MEKNFVFSNFGIAPHSATPDFFQNLLKTAKTANMEKHLFSKFWDTPQSASIVFRIFAEYATSSKNGKTFGFVPFGTAPHCATFFSWEFIENSKSSKHEKNTLPFGTRMKPQGMRQDKKKATAFGLYNPRSNGYRNSWRYFLLRLSNCYFYWWFRVSRVLVCCIASTLASTNLSFDRSG